VAVLAGGDPVLMVMELQSGDGAPPKLELKVGILLQIGHAGGTAAQVVVVVVAELQPQWWCLWRLRSSSGMVVLDLPELDIAGRLVDLHTSPE
jgi:hypothetical protein